MREGRAGDKPIEAAYLGDTPIKRMYAGGTLAWPPPPIGMDYSFSNGVLSFTEADDSCSACDGTGEEECQTCYGTGAVDGETCPSCGGEGLIQCPICGGDGMAHEADYDAGKYSYDATTGTLYIDEGGDGE